MLKKEYKDYNLYLKCVDEQQVFLIVSITNKEENPLEICKKAYSEIAGILIEKQIVIFHERIFGSLNLCESITTIRNSTLKEYSIDGETSFTYIDGSPYWGDGLSGINIHGVILKNDSDKVMNIYHENKVCGRIWRNKDSEYLMLHSIHGKDEDQIGNYNQTLKMFEKANYILKENGFEFKNVIRTWIYLNEILSQYNDFNKARNHIFRELNLIPNEIDHGLYEQVYMPASTGIDCNNPLGASGVMDVYAIKKNQDSNVMIYNETGKKQKSAFRYGSAFSRSMVVEDDKSKYIYLSGTASINDKGETVYIDDIKNQLEMTGSVIKELVKNDNFDFNNICESTVFLKRPEYISDYEEFCQKNGLSEIPTIITVADVCRDDLLFEMDATFAGAKNG